MNTKYFTAQEGKRNKEIEKYTIRETEVLHLISKGLSNPEIAEVLHLSTHTIHSHRKTLMQKMGVKNAALLVRRAFEYKLISI